MFPIFSTKTAYNICLVWLLDIIEIMFYNIHPNSPYLNIRPRRPIA